ncbi:MAG: hypothetical protein R3B72_26045 [Polyangiaceae bacterium]
MMARLGAVGLCYGYRALGSALMAMPLAYAIGGSVAGHPRGDAVLWDRGGIWLLEALRLSQASLGPALVQGGALGVVVALGWLLPLGGLMAVHGAERPSLATSLGRAAAKLPMLSVLFGVFLLIQALALAFFIGIGRLVAAPTATGDVLGLVLPVLCLPVWLAIVALHDATRVAAILGDRGYASALDVGWLLLAARPGRTALALLWRALVGVAVLFGAGWLTLSTLQGGRDALALVVVIDQLALLAIVLLRASWIGWLAAELPVTTAGIAEGAR